MVLPGPPFWLPMRMIMWLHHAFEGRDVCLVDADPQRSAARWHADREEQKRQPAIACVEKLGSIHQTLQDLATRYDIVIVDVAGKDSKEMRTGMTAADKLVVAVRPSQFDLDTLGHMTEVIEQALDFNPELDVRGLITQAPSNPNVTERTDAGEYLADYPRNAISHSRAGVLGEHDT